MLSLLLRLCIALLSPRLFQVNNWMMNVRVRRCRTKKIGVATGPEQITYPSATPKAIAVNRPRPRPAPQARLAPASSATFGGAMIPRQDVGAGGSPDESRALTTRLDVGGARSGVGSAHSGSSSPRRGLSSPSDLTSGATSAPWHLQQEPSHGGQIVPAASSMPV